jgi:hypothetical protein
MKENYANTDSIKTFIEKISKNNKIKEVVYQESLIDMVNKNVRIIGMIVLAFGGYPIDYRRSFNQQYDTSCDLFTTFLNQKYAIDWGY